MKRALPSAPPLIAPMRGWQQGPQGPPLIPSWKLSSAAGRKHALRVCGRSQSPSSPSAQGPGGIWSIPGMPPRPISSCPCAGPSERPISRRLASAGNRSAKRTSRCDPRQRQACGQSTVQRHAERGHRRWCAPAPTRSRLLGVPCHSFQHRTGLGGYTRSLPLGVPLRLVAAGWWGGQGLSKRCLLRSALAPAAGCACSWQPGWNCRQ